MRNMPTVHVRPHYYIMVALSLFILPIPFVLGWIAAAAFHEVCHLLMTILLRVKVLSVSIEAAGAKISTEPMSPVQELCCALAGPVGAMILLTFVRSMPYIALSAGVQSVYNLLPVYPLDGGRAVKSAVTCLAGEEIGWKIAAGLSVTIIILTALCGIWISYRYRLGILPVVFPLMPLLYIMRKNSLQRREKNCRIEGV